MKIVSEHIYQQVLGCVLFCMISLASQAQSCLSNPITPAGVQITNTERPDLGLNINGISLNRSLLSVTLTLTNLHQSVGAPSGMPVSFYDGDPALVSPRTIAQYAVPASIAAGQTSQYITQLDLSSLPVMPFYLYAIVGDDGTTPKPYTMDDLGTGPSGSMECFFLNNKARFSAIVPLPIELLDFTVNALTEDDFEFHWQTATERDNEGFYLELAKGTAGQYGFESEAFVSGQGNSQTQSSYTHVLRDLRPGQYYARLRQVDFSGEHSYSDVVSFKVESEAPLVYPTILDTDGNVNIYLSSAGEWQARLYDSEGRLLQTIEARLEDGENKTISLAANILSPGFCYLIMEERVTGSQWTEKLVVVRNGE